MPVKILHALGAETASGQSDPVDVSDYDKDETMFVLDVTALGGGPSAATLDVSIFNYDPYSGSTDEIVTFTQVTQATSLPNRQWRYNLNVEGLRTINTTSKVVLKKLGHFIRITWTIAFTGGTAPSWTFRCVAYFKKRARSDV